MPESRRQRSRELLFAAVASLPLLADWSYKIFVLRRAFWMHYFDDEANYFVESLHIAFGQRLAFVDHPGTPVIVLGSVIAAFTGRTTLEIQRFLMAGYVVGLIATVAAIIFLRRTLFRGRSEWLWVAAAWTFLLAPSALEYDTVWSPELWSFPVAAIAIVAVVRVRDDLRSVALAGAAVGFCVAIKFTFAAWVAALLLMLVFERRGIARAAVAAVSAATAFVVGTLPIADQYGRMLAWVRDLATHRDAFGSGPVAPPQLSATFAKFAGLGWLGIFFWVWLAIIAVMLIRRRIALRGAALFGVAAITASLVFALRAPGADFHYLLPVPIAAIAFVPLLDERAVMRLMPLLAVLMLLATARDLVAYRRLVREETRMRQDLDDMIARKVPNGVVLFTWRAPEPSFAVGALTIEPRFIDPIARRYPRQGHWVAWQGKPWIPPGAKTWDAVFLNERFLAEFPEPLGATVGVVPPFRLMLRGRPPQ